MQTLATQMGRECPMNIVGTVSEKEAKEGLMQHKGNMWPAVEECVRQRQKKVGPIKYSLSKFYLESMKNIDIRVLGGKECLSDDLRLTTD